MHGMLRVTCVCHPCEQHPGPETDDPYYRDGLLGDARTTPGGIDASGRSFRHPWNPEKGFVCCIHGCANGNVASARISPAISTPTRIP